jgi:hypothetical protein
LPDQRSSDLISVPFQAIDLKNKSKGKFAAMKIYQGLWLNQKQELQLLILQIFIDLDRG